MKRVCASCGIKKLERDFYKRTLSSGGGLSSSCKECVKGRSRLYYSQHREESLAAKTLYNLSHRKEIRVRDEARYSRLREEIIARNREVPVLVRKAHRRVQYLVKSGKLEKPTVCPTCAESTYRIEAHHHDYTKPLEVVWMCNSCHKKHHRRLTRKEQ